MRFYNLLTAISFKNRAFETTGTCLVVVMLEDHFEVCTNKEASRLAKQGYEILNLY